jgi:hypothetical protein
MAEMCSACHGMGEKLPSGPSDAPVEVCPACEGKGRDPRVNPRPYDVVEALGTQQHVHYVRDFQVYLGAWSGGASQGCHRISLEGWRESCRLYNVRVIQRAEDVEGDPLGLLEARS